jgi:hypothetical protein
MPSRFRAFKPVVKTPLSHRYHLTSALREARLPKHLDFSTLRYPLWFLQFRGNGPEIAHAEYVYTSNSCP